MLRLFLSDEAIVALQDPLTVCEAYTSDDMDTGCDMEDETIVHAVAFGVA